METISTLEIFIRLAIAYFMGLLIGFERSSAGKPAGIITNSTVALSTCALGIFQIYLFNETIALQNANPNLTINADIARIPAQVITGIGFLGAGAIITSGEKVTGLTTAAIVWTCAVLGLLVGFGDYPLAIALFCFMSFNMLVTSRLIYRRKFKGKFDE